MLSTLEAITLLALTPDAAGGESPEVRRGVLLVVLLAAGGFTVVFTLALWSSVLAGRRARRRAEARATPTPPAADAWAEAGRRVRPEDGDHWLEADPNDETRGV